MTPESEHEHEPEINWWYLMFVLITLALLLFGFVALIGEQSLAVRWVSCVIATGLYILSTSKPGDWKV